MDNKGRYQIYLNDDSNYPYEVVDSLENYRQVAVCPTHSDAECVRNDLNNGAAKEKL